MHSKKHAIIRIIIKAFLIRIMSFSRLLSGIIIGYFDYKFNMLIYYPIIIFFSNGISFILRPIIMHIKHIGMAMIKVINRNNIKFSLLSNDAILSVKKFPN